MYASRAEREDLPILEQAKADLDKALEARPNHIGSLVQKGLPFPSLPPQTFLPPDPNASQHSCENLNSGALNLI